MRGRLILESTFPSSFILLLCDSGARFFVAVNNLSSPPSCFPSLLRGEEIGFDGFAGAGVKLCEVVTTEAEKGEAV